MLTTFAAEVAPAGGTPIGEIVAASVVAFAAIAALAALGVAHRKRQTLAPLVALVEKQTGLPAWSTLPVGITGLGLITAVWGYYWDVSWHIDRGRDPGAFANPAHWFIIVGLDLIAFGGLLALILGDDRSPSSVKLTERWSVSVGGILLAVCGVIALAGFPLDDIWHRLFGQDVTAWGPTHIQLILGASLTTLGSWVLTVEGQRAAIASGAEITRRGRGMLRLSDAMLAGAFLIGLSTLQVEFDFGVPQFRALIHPVLNTLAASGALVAARIRLGRGGALLAAGFFIAVRGSLTLMIGLLGRDVPHFPLYLVEALIVEVVALAVGRDRQLTLGVVSGAAIGTVGLGAEWIWSHLWMPMPWQPALVPEVLVLCAVVGIAGGFLGGVAGRAVAPDGLTHQRIPRFVTPAAWAAIAVSLAVCLPMSAHKTWTAAVHLDAAPTDARTGEEYAFVNVALQPEAAVTAAEDANWFEVLAWQGSNDGRDDGMVRALLVRQPDGSYRTDRPVPIAGTWKTMLRLGTGASLQSVPIYLPDDPAIPAEAVPAADGTYNFVADKRVLQREARADRAGLERLAYAALGLVAIGWMVVIAWSLGRLDASRVRRPGRPRRSSSRAVPAPA